jgi:hypothetical protein
MQRKKRKASERPRIDFPGRVATSLAGGPRSSILSGFYMGFTGFLPPGVAGIGVRAANRL